ncbi:MAG: hypothetical protein M1821_006335 [Bathelium mastoideum]|nr:MAG: hypothetical protein M1821_006335 [Bathelium mastoideum]
MRLPYIPPSPTFASPTDAAILARILDRRGGALLELDRTLLHSPPVADGWNAFLLAIRTQTSLPATLREAAICRVAILNRAFYEWDHHLPLLLADPAFAPEGAQYILRAPVGHAARRLGLRESERDADKDAAVVRVGGGGGGLGEAEAEGSSTGSKAVDQVVDKVVDTISQAASSVLPSQMAAAGPKPMAAEETGGFDEKHLAVLAYTDAMTVFISVPEDLFAILRRHFSDREIVEITSTIAAYNCVSRFLVALDVGERAGKGAPSGGGGAEVE